MVTITCSSTCFLSPLWVSHSRHQCCAEIGAPAPNCNFLPLYFAMGLCFVHRCCTIHSTRPACIPLTWRHLHRRQNCNLALMPSLGNWPSGNLVCVRTPLKSGTSHHALVSKSIICLSLSIACGIIVVCTTATMVSSISMSCHRRASTPKSANGAARACSWR